MENKEKNRILLIGQHLTSRTEALRDYLMPRSKSLLVMAFGSAFIDAKESHAFFYEGGQLKRHIVFGHKILKKIKKRYLLLATTFFFYLTDFLRTILIFGKRFDVIIGISHFSGLLGVFLKIFRIGRINIYYCIDFYSPANAISKADLFTIKFENYIDKTAVLNSNEVWDISLRIKEGRLKYSNLDYAVYSDKNKIVPLGYDRSLFRNKDFSQIKRYAVVFVGVIVESQGLELFLEVMPDLVKIMPEIKAEIVGTGPYLKKFQSLVSGKNMEDYFEFHGFVKKDSDMADLVSSCALGISLWDNRVNKFPNSYFGDPGKTKLYTVCALPAIVSEYTVYAQAIKQKKAGIAIGYNAIQLINALKEILLEDRQYFEFRSSAIELAEEECDSERIFYEAWKL